MYEWRDDPYYYHSLPGYLGEEYYISDIKNVSDRDRVSSFLDAILDISGENDIPNKDLLRDLFFDIKPDIRYIAIYLTVEKDSVPGLKFLVEDIELPFWEWLIDPLYVATKNYCDNAVEYLLSLGMNLNDDEYIYTGPLWNAVDYGNNPKMVKMLLQKGATVDFIHLLAAIQGDKLEVFKLLMAYGGDISYEDAKEVARYHYSYSIVEYLDKKRLKDQRIMEEARKISRQRAVNVIYLKLLHAYYRPGGAGYFKAMDDFERRKSEWPQQ